MGCNPLQHELPACKTIPRGSEFCSERLVHLRRIAVEPSNIVFIKRDIGVHQNSAYPRSRTLANMSGFFQACSPCLFGNLVNDEVASGQLDAKRALLSFAGTRIKNYANQRNGDDASTDPNTRCPVTRLPTVVAHGDLDTTRVELHWLEDEGFLAVDRITEAWRAQHLPYLAGRRSHWFFG